MLDVPQICAGLVTGMAKYYPLRFFRIDMDLLAFSKLTFFLREVKTILRGAELFRFLFR